MQQIKEEEEASWARLDASSQISSWTFERTMREKNKSLRRVFEEANMNYGSDAATDTDLAERTKRAMNLRKGQVQDVLKKMQAAKNLDLCFMVDVTASMGSHINAVKEQIHAIVDKLTTPTKMPTRSVVRFASSSIVKKIRLAFVGYRDFGNTPQFEVLDFCESVNDFHAFCNSIQTNMANADGTEDVFGGLEKAIGLKWSTDGSTRMLFHIADAPCHGSAYHDYGHNSDRYPGGDPNGRSINSLLGQLENKDVKYHFGRITNYTDKMISEFSKIYGEEIVVCDIKDANLLLSAVTSSTSMAVTKAVGPSTRHMQFAASLPYDRAEPDWNAVTKTAGRFLTYELPQSMEEIFNGIPLKPKQPVKAIVQLASKPFAKGMERVAYYGRDVSSPGTQIDIVLKKYTTATGFVNSAPHYEGAIQLQTIAAYLASIFSAGTLEKVNHSSIKFLKGQVFTYKDPSTGRGIYMSCERRYPAGCDFLRFSNNFDYSMLEETAKVKGVDPKFVEQLMAFSHWTYQISRGYLMVVDLQGIICTEAGGRKSIELTDPAIHCTDLTRFGRTNLGLTGMKSFFSRHVCNQVCTQMGLIMPSATMMTSLDE